LRFFQITPPEGKIMNQYSHIDNRVHRGPIAAVTALRDQLLSGSYDGHLGLWKITDQGMVPERFIYLHGKGINCVAVSPDQNWIATGASDGSACLIETQFSQPSRPRVVRCDHLGDVECAVFSANSRVLLTGGTDGYVRLFDTTGQQLYAIKHGKTVGAACPHPDADLLVTGCNDRKLRLIDIRNRRIIREVESHQGPIKAVAVTAYGIISTAHDGKLLVHDYHLNPVRQLHQFTTTPKTLAVEPGGSDFWVGCYDGSISRWTHDSESFFHQDHIMYSARAWFHGLTVTESRLVISGSFDGVPLPLTSYESSKREADQKNASVPCVSALSLSTSGQIIFGGDSGRVFCIAVSDLKQKAMTGDSGRLIAETSGAITSLAGASNDMIVGTWNGEIIRWINSKLAWKARWSQQLDSTSERARSPVLRVSRANGRVLAGLYTGGWACFDEVTGKLLWSNAQATGAVKCVDVLGDLFAATGRYDPLRVGDATTGTVFGTLPLDTSVSDVVSFSPFYSQERPRLAVCAGDNEVWIVELVTKRDKSHELQVVHRSGGHQLPIKAMVWTTPDTVVAGDYGGRILAHSLDQPVQPVAEINCRSGVSALAISSSGDLIWSAFDGILGLHKLINC
jgi:WD40 repeat protein